MNLPNKLTLSRVIMVPFFVAAILLSPYEPVLKWVAIIIFITASITDLFDGKIARKYGLVTNFGKFMDPLADKLLVCSALICLVANGALKEWMAIVIISREFIISGLRLVASDNGVVIAASYWGKFKTVFQMIMIGFMIGDVDLPFFRITTVVLTWIALILTIVSLIDYIYKNRAVLKTDRH